MEISANLNKVKEEDRDLNNTFENSCSKCAREAALYHTMQYLIYTK